MVKVISVGNTCLDIIMRYIDQLPDWGTEKFCQESETRLAGQATNFAIASAKLSNKTYLVSSIGNDLIGKNFEFELNQLSSLDRSFLG
ncbi:MAG: PfkB family carbohydrate kinase [Candidatus Bathyarchaeia archaeon]